MISRSPSRGRFATSLMHQLVKAQTVEESQCCAATKVSTAQMQPGGTGKGGKTGKGAGKMVGGTGWDG